ncbi:MAG: metallophosphoesterase [Rhodospirillaceae bacterium]
MNFERPGPDRDTRGELIRDDAARAEWAAERRQREAELDRRDPRRKTGNALDRLVDAVHAGVAGTAWSRRWTAAAHRLVVTKYDVVASDLPAAFDGYRVLHVTDPHFGLLDASLADLVACVAGLDVDLVAFTGDYWERFDGDAEAAADELAAIVRAAAPRDGALATLGNHDRAGMVDPIERRGIPILANDATRIVCANAALSVVGVDDTADFHTAAAERAVADAPEGFKILLTHTPGLARPAAPAGFALYLCGHTHGGQLCLPGEFPIETAMGWRRRFARRGLGGPAR